MPPKDNTNADLLRLEKSVTENASGIEKLSYHYLSVCSDITDLKKVSADLLASVATLNQGMHLLLADRNSSSRAGAMAPVGERAATTEGRPHQSTDPVGAPPPSPRLPDLQSPRSNNGTRLPATQAFPPVTNYKLPKVDFPVFNGTGVRSWLQKAHRLFLIHPVPPDQKVVYASLSFRGKAEAWYVTEAALFERMNWADFVFLLNSRFSEEICENVVGEFSKLLQTESVQEYVEKFDDLRPLILRRNPGLTERFFVDSFLSGLKPEIKHSVHMFYPNSMLAVIQLARLQEANVESVSKAHRGNHFNPSIVSNSFAGKFSTFNQANISAKTSFPFNATNTVGQKDILSNIPIHKLSQSEMQARRDKRLCYTCDEPFSASHKCETQRIYMLAGDFDDVTELSDTGTGHAQSDNYATFTQQEVAISLNALSGSVSYQTLLLRGRDKKHSIQSAYIAEFMSTESMFTTMNNIFLSTKSIVQNRELSPQSIWLFDPGIDCRLLVDSQLMVLDGELHAMGRGNFNTSQGEFSPMVESSMASTFSLLGCFITTHKDMLWRITSKVTCSYATWNCLLTYSNVVDASMGVYFLWVLCTLSTGCTLLSGVDASMIFETRGCIIHHALLLWMQLEHRQKVVVEADIANAISSLESGIISIWLFKFADVFSIWVEISLNNLQAHTRPGLDSLFDKWDREKELGVVKIVSPLSDIVNLLNHIVMVSTQATTVKDSILHPISMERGIQALSLGKNEEHQSKLGYLRVHAFRSSCPIWSYEKLHVAFSLVSTFHSQQLQYSFIMPQFFLDLLQLYVPIHTRVSAAVYILVMGIMLTFGHCNCLSEVPENNVIVHHISIAWGSRCSAFFDSVIAIVCVPLPLSSLIVTWIPKKNMYFLTTLPGLDIASWMDADVLWKIAWESRLHLPFLSVYLLDFHTCKHFCEFELLASSRILFNIFSVVGQDVLAFDGSYIAYSLTYFGMKVVSWFIVGENCSAIFSSCNQVLVAHNYSATAFSQFLVSILVGVMLILRGVFSRFESEILRINQLRKGSYVVNELGCMTIGHPEISNITCLNPLSQVYMVYYSQWSLLVAPVLWRIACLS